MMGKRRVGIYVCAHSGGRGGGGEPCAWKYRELGNPRTVWIRRATRRGETGTVPTMANGLTDHWYTDIDGFEVCMRTKHRKFAKAFTKFVEGDLLDAAAVAAKMLEK